MLNDADTREPWSCLYPNIHPIFLLVLRNYKILLLILVRQDLGARKPNELYSTRFWERTLGGGACIIKLNLFKLFQILPAGAGIKW